MGWDYSSASWVFITINAYAETPPFGEVRDGGMFRNDLGESVARNWLLTIDEYADAAFKYSFRRLNRPTFVADQTSHGGGAGFDFGGMGFAVFADKTRNIECPRLAGVGNRDFI